MKKKVVKKGCKSGSCQPKLSKTEAEILHYLTNEYLTIKQISIRRGTSRQAVNKTLQKLKKKGLINQHYEKVDKSQPTLPIHKVRLHGQEFNVKILFKDKRYEKLRGRANTVFVDGCTVRLYRDSVEVYSNRSFWGEDVQKVTSESFVFWNRFFSRLESDLKVLLVKSRYDNVRLVNSHYSEVNNELSRDCKEKGVKLRVFTRDDGKLWFLIDNSFNLSEAETVHPESSKGDMEKVKDVFNDIRDKPLYPLSELSSMMADTVKQLNSVSHGLSSVVSFLKSQLPVEPKIVKGGGVKPDYVG